MRCLHKCARTWLVREVFSLSLCICCCFVCSTMQLLDLHLLLSICPSFPFLSPVSSLSATAPHLCLQLAAVHNSPKVASIPNPIIYKVDRQILHSLLFNYKTPAAQVWHELISVPLTNITAKYHQSFRRAAKLHLALKMCKCRCQCQMAVPREGVPGLDYHQLHLQRQMPPGTTLAPGLVSCGRWWLFQDPNPRCIHDSPPFQQ